MKNLFACGLGAALVSLAAAAQANDYRWTAGSGLLPSQAAPPFTLVDTADPENPVLANNLLRLSGNLVAETMYYILSGAGIGLPSVLEVDFSMRYVSGNRSTSVVAPAGVAITTSASGAGIALWIGQDEAFLSSASGGRGDSINTIDTDGALHDHRIVVGGAAGGSAVQLWQDGVAILGGNTFNSHSLNGTVPRVLFGEFSVRAAGVSEWTSFRAGAVSAVPEPAAAWLLLAGAPLLALRRRLSA